ncbi:MAG TPA: phage tail assembly chaperone [Allosphingosinicella sp.]
MLFSAGAARLAGVAGALLGWRPEEFWRATPAELAAVVSAMMPAGGEGMDSTELERLRSLFPDG